MGDRCHLEDRAHWLSIHVLPLEPELRRWLAKARHATFDIDDIIQETYAKLVVASDLRGVTQPRAYIYQAMRSVVVDRYRRKKVVSFTSMSEIDALDNAVDEITPEDHVRGRNELRFLLDRLGELPDKTRTVFLLSRVQGLSVKAVSAQTGIPASTVEKHIAKALKYLMDAAQVGGNPSLDASHAESRNDRGGMYRRRIWRFEDR